MIAWVVLLGGHVVGEVTAPDLETALRYSRARYPHDARVQSAISWRLSLQEHPVAAPPAPVVVPSGRSMRAAYKLRKCEAPDCTRSVRQPKGGLRQRFCRAHRPAGPRGAR